MKYKSSNYDPKKGDLIPTVIVEFHRMADLWITRRQYDAEGKFKWILKSFEVSISDVKKVHHVLKFASEYPTEEWEG